MTMVNASRLLWTIAIVVGLFCAVLWAEFHEPASTVLLFGVSLATGAAGGLVDLLRWVTR